MKRFFKKSWIAILALATTVVAACSSSKHTNKTDDSQNTSVNSDDNTATSDTLSASRAEVQSRLEELRRVIKEREMSDVYGSPEVIEEYQAETQRLRLEAAEIQKQIDAIEGKTPKNRKELQRRIEEIETTLQETISARVYGSPEVLQRHHERISTLEHERDSLRNELDALDDTEPVEIEE